MRPAASTRPARHIAFLLGKPPKPTTLFPELFGILQKAGVVVTVHLPHDQPDLPEGLAEVDLIVHRGLQPEALATVQALERAGIPVCNPPAATELARNRLGLAVLLKKARLPVPLTTTAATWEEARVTATMLSVIKTVGEADGRGGQVIAGTCADLPAEKPFAGPYLVQPFVPNEGVDRKLYVAGRAVRGLLKPSPLHHTHVTTGTPFAPDAVLTALAQQVGEVVGLELYGVDVLLGEGGPVVVDVNPFPGFRGVKDAPRLIAEHLLHRVLT